MRVLHDLEMEKRRAEAHVQLEEWREACGPLLDIFTSNDFDRDMSWEKLKKDHQVFFATQLAINLVPRNDCKCVYWSHIFIYNVSDNETDNHWAYMHS